MLKDILAHVMTRVTATVDGCWLSAWNKDKKGYSRIWHKGKMVIVHRLVYEKMVGPLDPTLQIDHLCNVPNCCNPEHLEQVTQLENLRRAAARMPAGVRKHKFAPRRKKTHCVHGHEFTEADVQPCGVKRCKRCVRERYRRRYETDADYRSKERQRKIAASHALAVA